MKTEMQNEVRFKLAAIDLDGTLLGPAHDVSAENFEAIERLEAAGTQVVLASGRHYHSMQKYVKMLPRLQWVVSCQGGEVSSADRSIVLGRKFMPAAEVRRNLALADSLGFTVAAYTVEGVVTNASTNARSDFEMKRYTDLAGHRPVTLKADELMSRDMLKVIWMGDPAVIDGLVLPEVTSATVQAVRTQARFLEFMPAEASKGNALELLARRLGIHAAEAVVFGDGDNDIPMFEWAGTSVAMPHGWPLAVRSAKYVAPAGPSETAFARGVDMVLQPGAECCGV
ncbi:MAG TPA: Cof-type HAD-IIB family hydrolase [Verrucomicrobiae bacterium]|nr:Cof-type HAD-IIB family hydrolase [Verrucomicrobiae bacterium]